MAIDFELLKKGLHGLEVAAGQFATVIKKHGEPPSVPKDSWEAMWAMGQAHTLQRMPYFALANAESAIADIKRALGIKVSEPALPPRPMIQIGDRVIPDPSVPPPSWRRKRA
jgi:hypothetical protein